MANKSTQMPPIEAFNALNMDSDCELEECKRKLKEAELKMQQDGKKLSQFDAFKALMDAGMQMRLEKSEPAKIVLELPDFTKLSTQEKGFRICSDPTELLGFRWELRAYRFANGTWMSLALNLQPINNHWGRIQFEVDCSFRISNSISPAKDIHKQVSAITLITQAGSYSFDDINVWKMAEIQELADPKNGFLHEDGSVRVKAEFLVRNATFEQFLVDGDEEGDVDEHVVHERSGEDGY